jgi:ketosteroid isomerase-like protein
MTEHPNAVAVRRAYQAFAAGDAETVRNQFTDDVLFHIHGLGDLDGDYRGPDEVFGYFGKLAAETAGTLRLELHTVLADDVHTVALLTAYAERKGRTLTENIVHITHVRDGKTSEFWEAFTDPAGIAAFWQ